MLFTIITYCIKQIPSSYIKIAKIIPAMKTSNFLILSIIYKI